MIYLNFSDFTSQDPAESLFCYDHINESCQKIQRPLNMQICMFITMASATIVTILGNLLVIGSIAHFKQLHTPTNYLILSLALCDFLLAVFVMPLSAVRSVYGCWYLTDFMCKIHTGMDMTLSTASIFHLTCVSAERFCAVCSPLKYRTRVCSATVICMACGSWLVSAVFGYAVIFSGFSIHGDEGFYDSHLRCIGGCHVFFSRGSAVVTSMVSFFIPGLVMFGIYSRIYVVARGQARSIDFLANQLRTDGHRARENRNRTWKGTMTVSIVVGVFLFCWTPFFLCNIIDPFIGFSISPGLIDALVWVGYLNSTLNPFIYAFLYPWFRKALRIIVSGEVFHTNSCRRQLYS